MNVGIIYMITSGVCLIQLLVILNRTTTTEYSEVIDLRFCRMLHIFAIFCIMDFLWGLCSSNELPLSSGFFTLVSYGYHSLAALSAFIWLGYILYYTDASPKATRVINALRYVLISIQFIALASNLFTHKAFSVSPTNEYNMGELRLFLYLLQYTYYVVAMVYCFYKLFTDRKHQHCYKSALLFSFIPFLFGIGQYTCYDLAMYALGFSLTGFLIYSYNVTSQREEFLTERFSSLDRQQSSIIEGLAGDFVSIYYVDLVTEEFDIFRKSSDGTGLLKEKEKGTSYFSVALKNGERNIYHKDLETFHQEFSKEHILEQLSNKQSYHLTYRIVIEGVPRYIQYRFVRPSVLGENTKMIVGVYNVDTEVRAKLQEQEEQRLAQEREISLKLQAERLSIDVYIDSMTGLYNRRSYEDDLLHNPDIPVEDDYVYISLDLNGLKTTNDNIGHEAGDELIRAAAYCMRTCLGSYGKLYRVGGDEFVATIFADTDKLREIKQDFLETITQWKGRLVDTLSISLGSASKAEFPNLSVKELGQIADKRMYEEKNAFYLHKGFDRRGQQEAFHAVCDSYLKILRANLSTDTFSILKSDAQQEDISAGSKMSFSDWIASFTQTSFVHPDDLSEFTKKSNLDFLRSYFTSGNEHFCMYYRRQVAGEFRKVMFEIIPSKEYADDNQNVFLYIKNIDL